MFDLFIRFCIINFVFSISINNSSKIIISLSSDKNTIYKSIIIINSILQQNVNEELYEILLMLSLNEYNNIIQLPKELQILENSKKIKIKYIKQNITNKLRTIITIKENKYNPIIFINNNCIFPDGWLKMFINDHLKYPDDAIAASIQYYLGKNNEINELSEGFKGEKFGTFNHVTELIFNFAIINIDMGGILYPANYFKNSSFYDIEYLVEGADISEEFWQSAFVIMDDKILRQSSKIFDYTKYWIDTTNYEEYYKNKKNSLKNDKLSILKIFPNFDDSITKRKNKIIVSITSYPSRFTYLPDLMNYIKKQTFNIDKIFFFLYKNDFKYFNFNMNEAKIISTEENLRPHLKYFYAMKLFRDHAIILLDDDIGYAKDTFESLYNEYIENPNVICGRRTHLMLYDNIGELKTYYEWEHGQTNQRKPDLNLLITNVGGSIYPPDILNIKDEFLPIIKETITCDDLTLKYFENSKGIPIKWVYNKHLEGINRILPKTNDSPLFYVNHINNDICINKLNIMINNTLLNNLCVQYRNMTTGNIIYLFDIHNKTQIDNVLYFDIYAYSHCPIDLKTTFNILFDNYFAFCYFRKSNISTINKNRKIENTIIASCNISNLNKNLEDYYFPSTKSNDSVNIKIYNYKKYSTIIYNNFYCSNNSNNCYLRVILYELNNDDKFIVKINKKPYLCYADFNQYTFINLPIIRDYKCHLYEYFNDKDNNVKFISGIPKNVNLNDKTEKDSKIPIKFVIHRIFTKVFVEHKNIIFVGKLSKELKEKTYYFSLNIFQPDIYLNCNIKPNSNIVTSYINCSCDDKNMTTDILIENQIVNLNNNEDKLLLINEETIIKINFGSINNKNKYYKIRKYNLNWFQIQLYCFISIFMIKISILIINFKLKK